MHVYHVFRDYVHDRGLPDWDSEIDKNYVSSKTILMTMPFVPQSMQQLINFRHARARPPYFSNCEFQVLSRQLLLAVQHLQAHEVVHRDLKPDNILVHAIMPHKQLLILSDFGTAFSCRKNGVRNFRVTYMDGFSIGGATAFLGPEIARELSKKGTRVLDYSKSDNYSCGLVFYAMLASPGVDPFDERGSYQPLHGYDSEIQQLIEGLLRQDAKERLTIAAALLLVGKIQVERCTEWRKSSVPVIVRRRASAGRNTPPLMGSGKFRVPHQTTVAQFILWLPNKLKGDRATAVFVFVVESGSYRMPASSSTMLDLHQRYQQADGCLHLEYACEQAFD
jgi:serine/threonine protein kinase